MSYPRWLTSAFVLAACLMPQAASADDASDFFKGKTITYVLPAGAGGAYGLNARVLANHMPKHVPGNPNIVLQHMPGAGGLKASNYIYNAALKDGTTWSMPITDLAVVQRLRPDHVRYDATKLGWIGRMGPYVTVLSVYDSAGVRNLEDLKSKTVILGHTGRSNLNFIQALMLEELLGLNLDNVAGYRGGSDLYLAMEQGEIHGRIGSWASLKTTKADWLAAGKMHTLITMSPKRVKDLPDVPTVLEIAADEATRKAFAFFSGATEVGWSAATPPDLPSGRLAVLRTAFDATMADPAFQAEMKERRLDFDPLNGAELEVSVRETLSTPQAIVELISTYMPK